MPSRHKRLLFCTCGLSSLCCALAAAVATGLPLWVQGTVLCRTGAELVNASGAELDKFLGGLSYGLFGGERVKQCGLGGRASRFSFFPQLQASVPVLLHVSTIFFCGLVLLFSSLSCAFFFFNAFGRPQEALHGPRGLYLWTLASCACSGLVMALFSSEVKLHHLSERISNVNEDVFTFQTYSESYGRSFWLFLLVLLLQALNALLTRLAGIRLPFWEAKPAEGGGGAMDLLY
ncbi:clarin-1 [Synchiropus splendidus]|uniref:clarin-1 n=1 Tax=Synchiropus splendidus TaxID=270530 RepID=UPI00237E03AA|nr:clarin-1 [Synchiropus splendidus]